MNVVVVNIQRSGVLTFTFPFVLRSMESNLYLQLGLLSVLLAAVRRLSAKLWARRVDTDVAPFIHTAVQTWADQI